MEDISKKTITKPPTDRQPMSDNDLLRLLADHRGHSVPAMVAHCHVTTTAIRQRLTRLTWTHSVTQKRGDATGKRGRPQYLFFITSKGEATLATACEAGNV